MNFGLKVCIFGGFKQGVSLNKLGGLTTRKTKHRKIARQVGDTKLGQAVLTVAEEVSGASKGQILIGDLKAVDRISLYFKSGLLSGFRIGNKDTVGFKAAPAYSAP